MIKEKDRHKDKGFFLRLPPTLHKKIKALAKTERRTMNAQIVTILAESVKQ